MPVPVVVLWVLRLCLVQARIKLVPTTVTRRTPGSVSLEVDLGISIQSHGGHMLYLYRNIHVLLPLLQLLLHVHLLLLLLRLSLLRLPLLRLLLLHEHLLLIHHVHVHRHHPILCRTRSRSCRVDDTWVTMVLIVILIGQHVASTV